MLQRKLQDAKSALREECKTKTLQRVKVLHEIVQYIKRVQQEKKYNMKRLLNKKVQQENGAQKNNGPCVDGTLYTGN